MKTIDLNCDLGEGVANEEALLPFISSCSIACGGHYGNASTIQATIAMAKNHNVNIGAHPSYPDRDHFGRKSIAIKSNALADALRHQFDLFFKFSTNTNHIKPHGALYNDLVFDSEKANLLLSVLSEYCHGIKIYCPSKSELSKAANAHGFHPQYEGFGDRAYHANGTLVPRSKSGSVLTQADQIAYQIVQIVQHENVFISPGKAIPLVVDTICLHGDTPGLVSSIGEVIRLMNQNGIYVAGR